MTNSVPTSRRTVLLGCCGLLALGVGGTSHAAQRPALSQWIREGNPRSGFRAMLEDGADPLLPDIDGDTAVHYAASARDPAYLQILLARGISPDTANTITQRTPIMSAMMAERERQFDMLLRAGASVSLADRMENTPLHVAAQINEPKWVLRLLEAGAPAEARNRQGQTFQRYLFMTPDHLLNSETRRTRHDVAAWLRSNGIALQAAQ